MPSGEDVEGRRTHTSPVLRSSPRGSAHKAHEGFHLLPAAARRRLLPSDGPAPEKGLGPAPSGLWGLPHSPTPARAGSSLAFLGEFPLTRPHTHFRPDPLDQRAQDASDSGALGLPALPARDSLRGFQVQHTNAGCTGLPWAHHSHPNTRVETYVCPPNLSPLGVSRPQTPA